MLTTTAARFCNYALLSFTWIPVYCFNKQYIDEMQPNSKFIVMLDIWVILSMAVTTFPMLFAEEPIFVRVSHFVQRALLSLLVMCLTVFFCILALLIITVFTR